MSPPTVLEVLRQYKTELENEDLEQKISEWDKSGEIGVVDENGEFYTHPERLQKEKIKVIKRIIDGRSRIKDPLEYLHNEVLYDDCWLRDIVSCAVTTTVTDIKEREDYRYLVALSEKVRDAATKLQMALWDFSTYEDGRGMVIPHTMREVIENKDFDEVLSSLVHPEIKSLSPWHYLLPAIPPSRENNLHGAFVETLDLWLTDITYVDGDGRMCRGFHLSHTDMARLAEVCLGLPHGSVNPKSIRHKRVKLKEWEKPPHHKMY